MTTKKILSIILAISMLFTIFTFSVSANENTDTYVFTYEESVIEIPSDELTYEQAQAIADGIYYGDDGVDPCGIFCIFGHSLATTVATETTHKVYSSAPRCVRKIYNVEYCTRSSCDYSKATLISSVRLQCC